ncbi:MAG: tetratricopeptide repeat protein, partial [Armatimonadetes bacterium]|nr:tetratricopeptide repeat protein [Armatimonadota bacterium]
VLYQAVGERLGWPLAGVNLPGHFLVGYWSAERLWLVDPFHGGAAVDVARCLELAGAARADTAYALERPAPPHLVVRRMLMNLEGSFLRRGDIASLRNVAQKALLLDPTAAEQLRRLGQVHHRLGDRQQALACWHSYLATEPDAPDRSLLEAEIVRLETELDNP